MKDSNSKVLDAWSICGLAVLAGCLLFIALTEFFPFQDVPQHLSYAKIMGTYGDNANRFRDFYYPVDEFISYHTTHHFLAMFADNADGVETGLKVLLFLYILFAAGGFLLLVRTLHEESWKQSLWRFIFFPLVVFNATAGMGFLPFVVGMPFLFYVLSFSTRWQRSSGIFNPYFFLTALFLFLSSLIHVVLPFFFGVILLIYHFNFVDWKKYLTAHGLWAGMVILCAWGWGGFRGDQLMGKTHVSLADSFNYSYGFGFINQLFRIEWTNPFVMLNYVSWNFVGCFRLKVLLVFWVMLLATLYFVRRWQDPVEEGESVWPRQGLQTFLGVFALGILLPWGIYAPSEITFINYRFMSFAVMLAAVVLPGSWVGNLKQKQILTAYCLIHFSVYSTFTWLYQDEAREPQELLASLPQKMKLSSIVFHDKSEYFAKILDLTHFLPMYYTIRHNGLNSQFWARYTKHLPVEYKRGKKVNGPPDWKPWEFKKEDLEGVDYVILQSGGDPKREKYSATLYKAFEKAYPLVSRKGHWSIFKIAR